MNVEILSIGEEVLLGRIADTNAAWLAQRLTDLGCAVTRHTTVGDSERDMLDALRCAVGRADALLITGGLGPTLDDMTRGALAQFAGVELVADPHAREHLEGFFRRLGRPMTDNNLRQTYLPAGSELIPNPRGTAVGVRLVHEGVEIFALPGVPIEMKMMFDQSVGPALGERASSAIVARHLRIFGLGESAVGKKLDALMRRGANPEVGTQVDGGVIGVRALARADTREEAERMAAEAAGEIVRLVGKEYVFGEDEDRLEDAVARELERTGLTLAVAESCTGGALASGITNAPGVSRFFLEGAVTYSNQSKTARLGVPEALIREKGAVSAEVAESMAAGMCERSGADLALGLTGIAGPGGATATKPVGLVYIALAHAAGVETREFRLIGRREEIKDRAAKNALNMARLHLMKASSAG